MSVSYFSKSIIQNNQGVLSGVALGYNPTLSCHENINNLEICRDYVTRINSGVPKDYETIKKFEETNKRVDKQVKKFVRQNRAVGQLMPFALKAGCNIYVRVLKIKNEGNHCYLDNTDYIMVGIEGVDSIGTMSFYLNNRGEGKRVFDERFFFGDENYSDITRIYPAQIIADWYRQRSNINLFIRRDIDQQYNISETIVEKGGKGMLALVPNVSNIYHGLNLVFMDRLAVGKDI